MPAQSPPQTDDTAAAAVAVAGYVTGILMRSMASVACVVAAGAVEAAAFAAAVDDAVVAVAAGAGESTAVAAAGDDAEVVQWELIQVSATAFVRSASNRDR